MNCLNINRERKEIRKYINMVFAKQNSFISDNNERLKSIDKLSSFGKS